MTGRCLNGTMSVQQVTVIDNKTCMLTKSRHSETNNS